jgi:hypothetical protein
MRYLIRWVGYGPDHDEWLSGTDMKDTAALNVWEGICNKDNAK